MERWQPIRTILLFMGGMGFAYHEVVIATAPRDLALLLAATMMGLPFLLNKDEKSEKETG